MCILSFFLIFVGGALEVKKIFITSDELTCVKAPALVRFLSFAKVSYRHRHVGVFS